MTAINFTAYTNDAPQAETIKAFKIKFNTEKQYNGDFVAKIEGVNNSISKVNLHV